MFVVQVSTNKLRDIWADVVAAAWGPHRRVENILCLNTFLTNRKGKKIPFY